MRMVRYADDLVVLSRWKPPRTYIPKLKEFLPRLRVTVNEDKTRIIGAKDGFDSVQLLLQRWVVVAVDGRFHLSRIRRIERRDGQQ